MLIPRLALIAIAISVVAVSQSAFSNPGLPTRNLNPVLQQIYLPGFIDSGSGDGWHMNHSLYISNSFHRESVGDENLILDVENYRYELGLRYRRGNWALQTRLPFSANRGGKLDTLIEGWHSTFGLPGGNRETAPRDALNIAYLRDGVVEFSQTESTSGFGDMSVAIGYQPPGKIGYFLGLELPTGSSSNFTSNESIDVALWLTGSTEIGTKVSLYGLAGVSLPADDGILENLLVDKIWVAQAGMAYRFAPQISGFAQLDIHSKSFNDSALKAFGKSSQILFGLGFDDWMKNHRVELFFAEDIDVGSAPDISFGLRIVQRF